MPRKLITFEAFIEKSHKEHGTKYDYSLVNIISSVDKIKIICPVHGIFEQLYSTHIQGYGCPGCSGNKRLTKYDFIKRSQKIHGDGVYGYDLVDIVNSRKKVKIMCFKSDHGIFEQAPYAHLFGNGCPKCRIDKLRVAGTLSKEDFISKSKSVHGENTFDYSLLEYTGSHTKAKFICKIHGVFEQTPNNNLNGSGCPACSGNKKLTKEEFVYKSKKVHGDKYDYSRFIYRNNRVASIVTCPYHGEFFQSPDKHMLGCGCPLCGKESSAEKRTSNTEEFIKKAQKVHGSKKYDYSKVKYVDAVTRVSITCNSCNNEFNPVAENHLVGQECPNCCRSYGETYIKEWLAENGFEYKHQHTFPDLKGLGSYPLRFDFYVPVMNLLIEFDGEQHSKPICFNGISMEKAISGFKKVQINDSIKNKYCESNKIPLLRINYKEYKFIPDILRDRLLNGSKK